MTTKWGHRTPIDEAVRKGKNQVISWWLSGSPSSNSVERAFELSIAPQDQESTVWSTILDDPRAVQLLRTSGRPYVPRSLQVSTTPNGPQLRRDRVAIVKRLLALGFNPDAELDGKTASDIAASNLDLVALRIVDTNHRHGSLLRRFVHQKGSDYLGRWSNGKDNFKQKILVLTTNGQDTFQGSTDTFPILWCFEGNTLQVHLPFAKANGAPDPIMSGTLSQDGNYIECRFPKADGTVEAEVLTRSTK